MKTLSTISMIAVLALILTACGTTQNTRKPSSSTTPQVTQPAPVTPSSPAAKPRPSTPKQKTAKAKPNKGGYYLDDGPHANPPANIEYIPDAIPKIEKPNRSNSRPYTVMGKRYYPMKKLKPFQQTGLASWYGKRFHGRKTANGERYDMYAMTAAHKTLPIPSYVKVTNTANQKTIIVRVNDRGPFAHKRIIDLSYAAAKKLGMVKRGVGEVKLKLLMPKDYTQYAQNSTPTQVVRSNTPQFEIQAGAFKHEANANKLKKTIIKQGITAQHNINKVYNRELYQLKLGPFNSEAKARKIAAKLLEELSIASIILRR